MHTVIAETLALGYTHRVFFETQEFLQSRYKQSWPRNPEEQVLEMRYGDQINRLEKIKTRMPRQEENQAEVDRSIQKWYQKVNLWSVPIFRLFQSLRNLKSTSLR